MCSRETGCTIAIGKRIEVDRTTPTRQTGSAFLLAGVGMHQGVTRFAVLRREGFRCLHLVVARNDTRSSRWTLRCEKGNDSLGFMGFLQR